MGTMPKRAELPDELPDRGDLTLREWKLVDPEGFREYRRIVSLRHYHNHREEYLERHAAQKGPDGRKLRSKLSEAERKRRKQQRSKAERAQPGYRDKRNAARRAAYAANPASRKAANDRFRQAHPEWSAARNRMNQHRRRASAAAPFTATQLLAKSAMYAGCWVCGGPKQEIDHVKPLSRGGLHALANLRPICLPCNRQKGTKWPLPIVMAWVEFRRSMNDPRRTASLP